MSKLLPLSLEGKNVLVCGASAGIGRASALAIATLGATVCVAARRAERLERLLPELESAGAAGAHAFTVDLEDPAAIDALVRATQSAVGTVHVLINNAGGPPSGPLLQAESQDFLTAFQRHLFASHQLVKALVPGMEAASYGRIVNIISTSVREPIPNLGVSNTLRAAMGGWSKTLSRELPPNITINNLLPGFTDTERLSSLADAIAARTGSSAEQVHANWLAQVPEGRLGKPEELAAVIAFLVSPAAAYVRGVSLAVDGGRMKSI